MQRTQQFHSEWLQELILQTTDPTKYRKLFAQDGNPPSELNPVMLPPYIAVMTDAQNRRYRQWLLAQTHEPFTIAEIRDLEKALATLESATNKSA